MKKNSLILLGAFALTACAAGAAAAYNSNSADSNFKAVMNSEESTAAAEAEYASYDGTSLDGQNGNFIQLSTTDLMLADDYDTQPFSYSNVADVTEAAMPSIVAITNRSVQQVRTWFSRGTYQYDSVSAGSGIIVGENENELLICTNNHVVEGAQELSVTFIDDETYPATTKGTDPKNDLAVVAVNLEDISDETMSLLKIALIGDSDTMRVGEQVVAIGNALGYGQSVTTGIISAKDRTIQASDGYGNVTTYENLIQTDAAINMGNSGGALLNMNGEVIGINSARAGYNNSEGMGYAIPISKAMPILEDLMSRKTRVKLAEDEYGYIGITGQNVSYDATMLYGIPAGVYVVSISENSPASECGLQEGDIITSFDGEELSSMEDLLYILQYYAPGEEVELGVYTNVNGVYQQNDLTVTLGDRNQ